MSKEEITKKAWEIFNSVLDTVEFPSYVTFIKNEDKSCMLVVTLNDEWNGKAIFSYQPNVKAVEYWITQEKSMEEVVGSALADEFTVIIAQAYVQALLTNFHVEIYQSFQSFSETAGLILSQLPAEAIRYLPKNKHESEINIEEVSKKSLKDFLDSRRNELKERINQQIKGEEDIRKPAKNLIEIFYLSNLLQWKKAKKFYKQNKNFKNWEQLITLAFPDLPTDLITRLSDADKYIAMPSAIALEHAARLCGFENNIVELRTLQNYLRESRKWLDGKSEEEIVKELNKFIGKVSQQIITKAKIFHSLGEEFNFEKYPYIYQLMYQQALQEMSNESQNNENK